MGRSRSVKNVADTKLLLRWRWQKQVPTFFKAHLHSNAQKGSQKSGSPELKSADKNLLKKIKKNTCVWTYGLLIYVLRQANRINGSLVKGLRRCPLTAESWVRFPYELLQRDRKLSLSYCALALCALAMSHASKKNRPGRVSLLTRGPVCFFAHTANAATASDRRSRACRHGSVNIIHSILPVDME